MLRGLFLAKGRVMTIEIATEADIPAIMEIERTPGFEDVVGRWSQEQHAQQMAKASTRYCVLRDGGEVKAFAIFQDIGEPDRRVHLKRIVASDPGQGSGTRLLGQALDWLYTETRPTASTSISSSRTSAPATPTRSSASSSKAAFATITAPSTAASATP